MQILGAFHAASKPLIQASVVPDDVKIITLQKHFQLHQQRPSLLLRIEHIYQKRDNLGSVANIQLGI